MTSEATLFRAQLANTARNLANLLHELPLSSAAIEMSKDNSFEWQRKYNACYVVLSACRFNSLSRAETTQ